MRRRRRLGCACPVRLTRLLRRAARRRARRGPRGLAPTSGGPATRRTYRGNTLVLTSEWDTPDGTVHVLDFMPPRGDSASFGRFLRFAVTALHLNHQPPIADDDEHVADTGAFVRHTEPTGIRLASDLIVSRAKVRSASPAGPPGRGQERSCPEASSDGSASSSRSQSTTGRHTVTSEVRVCSNSVRR